MFLALDLSVMALERIIERSGEKNKVAWIRTGKTASGDK